MSMILAKSESPPSALLGGGESSSGKNISNSFEMKVSQSTVLEVQAGPSEVGAPKLSLKDLFFTFLSFGFRAFGGPVAQIAMMKQQLVLDEKWVTVDRFNRVFAVYQALPGPEATELACYFGLLSRGRIGAFLGGLGFMLPGFFIVLLLAWIYKDYGLEDKYFQASFKGVEPAIAALIFFSTHKLSLHAFEDKTTKTFSYYLAGYAMMSFLVTVMGVNFFIPLFLSGVLHILFSKKTIFYSTIAYSLVLLLLAVYIIYVSFHGALTTSSSSFGAGLPIGSSYGSIFLLGLTGGLLTFGGAYTAIPFVYAGSVIAGGWITDSQFLDAIAVTSIAPTPLVMFVSFIGFLQARIVGSLLMTVGMFLPAFSFTLIGHELFEKAVDSSLLCDFLDGISASVIGLVLVTAFEFTKKVLVINPDDSALSVVIFFLSLGCYFSFKGKMLQPSVLVIAAIAGQILFRED